MEVAGFVPVCGRFGSLNWPGNDFNIYYNVTECQIHLVVHWTTSVVQSSFHTNSPLNLHLSSGGHTFSF